MSKKLSQSEIDALVANLLTGDTPAGDAPAAPAPPEGEQAALAVPAEAAPAQAPAPQAVESAPAPAAGRPPANIPFELVQDLGPIAQAEVDAALSVFKSQRAGTVAAPAAPPAPPATAPTMAMPPSAASYAASQAQAAQQTRKALSMAALSGVLKDIELTVTVELGSARLSLGEVLALGPGSVVTLDKLANTPVDVLVNRLPLMKAEILAIGEKYGVRVTQSNLNARAAS